VRGSTGVIVKSPSDAEHSYRVRFPGGEEASMLRREFQVLKRYQQQGLTGESDPLLEYDLDQYVIYRCVVGSRAYGLDHAESDIDRRGIYLPPADMHWSLYGIPQQLENNETDECYWELQKFLTLALKANPNLLEVLYSPMIVCTTPEHDELKAVGRRCITRHHAHHYLGFSRTQWDLFSKEDPPRVKPLLYVYRVLLTGIHLMRTGRVEANLITLNEEYRLPYISELVARKIEGAEKGTLDTVDLSFHQAEYERLTRELEQAGDESDLPDAPSARDALNDLILRARGS